MARKVTITFDEDAGKCVAVGEELQVSIDQPHKREETYKNMLINGAVTVVDVDGTESVYNDGCHLVEQSDKFIHAMSKPDYAVWCGRPGTENED
jgi:hypothetical protein